MSQTQRPVIEIWTTAEGHIVFCQALDDRGERVYVPFAGASTIEQARLNALRFADAFRAAVLAAKPGAPTVQIQEGRAWF